jgi:hypothetical protein
MYHVWGERRGVYWVLMGKHEGKKPLGRPRHRWEDTVNTLNAELNPICQLLALLGAHRILHISRIRVKMDVQEVGWEGMVCIGLA